MNQPRIDLNADMGESFGPWLMGNDAALLDVISSANIACGLHAGDWDVMAHTMRTAVQNGVGIGAHPGFPDLQGFGRREMQMANSRMEREKREAAKKKESKEEREGGDGSGEVEVDDGSELLGLSLLVGESLEDSLVEVSVGVSVTVAVVVWLGSRATTKVTVRPCRTLPASAASIPTNGTWPI